MLSKAELHYLRISGTWLCLKSHPHFRRVLYCWERGRPRPQTVVSTVLSKKANAVRATRSMWARAPAFPALASLIHKKIPFLGKAACRGSFSYTTQKTVHLTKVLHRDL